MNNLTKEQLQQLKEVVDCLVDYSQANIISSNFVEGFYKYTVNGTLYGNYKLFGAKSFRLTSSKPNLLNTPSTGSIYAKPVKQCFEAKEGKIFYIVDLNALEDRVIANLSDEPNKISIFTDNLDGHCFNSYYYFKERLDKELPREKDESIADYSKRYKKEVDNGNKVLKEIRQDSKPCSFALAYGCFPEKLASIARIPIKEAERIFDSYHNELYPKITEMRDRVLDIATQEGRIHLGLGCYINTSNPRGEIRTLFNACSQFWSILTLLTINKLNYRIRENNYQNRIEVVSTIYDSIYIHMDKDAKLVKWVNDTVIPILTTNFLENQKVKNSAEGEVGLNWYDTVKLTNNCSLEDINNALSQLNQGIL